MTRGRRLAKQKLFDAKRRAGNQRPVLEWERRRARYVLDEVKDMDVRNGRP